MMIDTRRQLAQILRKLMYTSESLSLIESACIADMANTSRHVATGLDKLVQGRAIELSEDEGKHIRSMIAHYEAT